MHHKKSTHRGVFLWYYYLRALPTGFECALGLALSKTANPTKHTTKDKKIVSFFVAMAIRPFYPSVLKAL
jgi:hypothetical protein